MKTQSRIAALAAAVTAQIQIACLRSNSAFAEKGVEVDESAGVIRGAAIMTIGNPQGHGWTIDALTIKQVEGLINASPDGVRSRFMHPEMPEPGKPMPEDLGKVVGRVKNARVDGNTLRGDVFLGQYASKLPGFGDVRGYLLARAKEDAKGFGLSAVIQYDLEPVMGPGGTPRAMVARVDRVDAVDFVGKGAATPNGLLSSQQQTLSSTLQPTPDVQKAPGSQGVSIMNEKIKSCLTAHFGLAAGASDEDAQKMYDEKKTDVDAKMAQMAANAPANGGGNAAALAAQNQQRLRVDSGDELLAMEGKRVAQLQQLGTALNVDAAIVQLAIANGEDATAARTRYLTHLQAKCKPIDNLGGGEVHVGVDKAIASLSAAVPDAICLRAGAKIAKPHERAAKLSGLSLIDMGRQYLVALGVGSDDAMGLSRTDVWKALVQPGKLGWRFAQLAQSSGSFLNLTLDAANKSLRQAYLDGVTTWTRWARRATAPDFKNVNRIALSDSPGLNSRSEGGEIKFVVMSDSKEAYALTEYTGGIRLTRQAIINDDLDAFGRIPQLQGAAARRKEDDVCYSILTTNAALSDSVALFNSSHSNYTSSGTAISVTSMGVARGLLRKQTGPKGAYLNLIPKFIIVPAELESIVEQYTSSQFVSATSANINPFAQGMSTPLQPVVEPRLSADSATKWYMASDTSQIDTVEVCFLQDEPEPVLKQEVDFDTDDVKFAVRHTVAAKAIDYRGLYLNAGA